MRRVGVIGVVVLGLLLTGCTAVDQVATSSETPEPVAASPSTTPTPTSTPTPTATPTPEPTEEAGEEAVDDAVDGDASTEEAVVAQVSEPEPEPELVAGPPIWGIGSQGDEVRELQARLRQIRWFDRDPTGYYGQVTANAVSGFQGKRGFPVVGYVDQRTWDRIVSMTTPPTQDELFPPPPEPEPEPEVVEAQPAVPGLDSRCTTGRAICIDKSKSLVRWVVNGDVQLTMDARFGSELTPTREGLFSVKRNVRDENSRLYDDAPMPYAVYVSGGQAVHYSPDFVAYGYNGSSHGCVNTRDWNGMSYLFDAARIGDKVVVYWS